MCSENRIRIFCCYLFQVISIQDGGQHDGVSILRMHLVMKQAINYSILTKVGLKTRLMLNNSKILKKRKKKFAQKCCIQLVAKLGLWVLSFLSNR